MTQEKGSNVTMKRSVYPWHVQKIIKFVLKKLFLVRIWRAFENAQFCFGQKNECALGIL